MIGALILILLKFFFFFGIGCQISTSTTIYIGDLFFCHVLLDLSQKIQENSFFHGLTNFLPSTIHCLLVCQIGLDQNMEKPQGGSQQHFLHHDI